MDYICYNDIIYRPKATFIIWSLATILSFLSLLCCFFSMSQKIKTKTIENDHLELSLISIYFLNVYK